MREDATTCSWCWTANTGDNTMECIDTETEDPSSSSGALGPPPKMASSEDGAAGAFVRAPSAEPDAGIPDHVGPVKQLHSGTGYNLVIDTEGKVYGTREPYNSQAIMEITAREGGEVQIRGQQSKFYLAMDEKGKIYAESEADSPNTWFREYFERGWNYYMWLGNSKQWFLGIKKSGKIKPGPKTKMGQKSAKFVPRTATEHSPPRFN